MTVITASKSVLSPFLKIGLLLVLILSILPVYSQQITNGDSQSDSITEWIKNNTRSLDFSQAATDTTFLKSVLRDKNIVLLGEDSHGTASFSLAKTDLIKFLHQSLGYDVLVFESNMGDCLATDLSIQNEETSSSIKGALHFMWHTRELIPLFDYIRQSKASDRPLILTGVDAEPSSFAFSRYLYTSIKSTDEAYAKQVFSFDSLFVSNYKRLLGPALQACPLSKAELRKIRKELKANRKAYSQLTEWLSQKKVCSDQQAVVFRVLKDRVRISQHVLAGLHSNKAVRKLSTKLSSAPTRDAIMCDNLEYLYKVVYPGKKIIVWAHDAHMNTGPKRMGGYGPIRSTTYSIGLFAYSGKGAFNDRSIYELKYPEKNSLEEIIGRSDRSVTFLDLSRQTSRTGNFWIFSPVKFKYWDGSQQYKDVIRNKFDGIILLKKITPPVYLN